ncbi:hypothetical protein [Vibrio sinaloensis]|uniref:hypothetical protein n=1 Tax=Photobacterium sp. (strain ATCC 43367) TaxID=379097 RepID=UPI0035E8D512
MKKLALLSLGAVLLSGCASEPQVWKQTQQVSIAQTSIELNSKLWRNKMPTIGEVQESTLHGALYLESDQTLPAQLDVEFIVLKQGQESWQIDSDLLDLRTHNQNQWEVAFVWRIDVDIEQTVDIAIEINVDDQVEWLVEQDVKIDTVY